MGTFGTFVQKRLVDGLEYRFAENGVHEGRPSFERTDGKVLVRWHPDSGWVACDPAGVENGWHVFPADTPRPDEGFIYSRKGEKSYTYCRLYDPDGYADLAAEVERRRLAVARTHRAADLDPRAPDAIRERLIRELGLS